MNRMNITIHVNMATKEEASASILTAIERMAAGEPRGSEGVCDWSATLVDEGIGGYGCDPNDLPDWPFGGDFGGTSDRREHDVGGQRWVRNDHMILAVRGKAKPREERTGNRLLRASSAGAEAGVAEAVRKPMESLRALKGDAYLDPDMDGDEAYHFRVMLSPCRKAFALRYTALIEHLYPGCSWEVEIDGPAQALDVEGRVVAVLMPTTDDARHA